jgi:hypothetical protein
MARRETIGLEAVLALATRLSPVDKLKLVEHLLVELEPIVEREGPRERRSSQHAPNGKAFTGAEVGEIERKLGKPNEARQPKRVIQLEGFGKTLPSISALRRSVRHAESCLRR